MQLTLFSCMTVFANLIHRCLHDPCKSDLILILAVSENEMQFR